MAIVDVRPSLTVPPSGDLDET